MIAIDDCKMHDSAQVSPRKTLTYDRVHIFYSYDVNSIK